jgi:long-chain acyl-CoA synthetase
MPDGTYGEKVIAFVALRTSLTASEHELREHARQRLADYKVPEKVLFLAELPKGITGKLQRRLLKQMANS